MIGTTKSAVFGFPVPQRIEGDASWYGTLCMLAACLGLLTILFFSR